VGSFTGKQRIQPINKKGVPERKMKLTGVPANGFRGFIFSRIVLRNNGGNRRWSRY
jgi:hypothetical protein